MSTVVQCPSCRTQMSVGAESAGGLVRCPKCGTVLRVPAAPQVRNVPAPAPVRPAPPPLRRESVAPAPRSAPPPQKIEQRPSAIRPKSQPSAQKPPEPKAKRPRSWLVIGVASGCGVAVLGTVIVGLIVGIIAFRSKKSGDGGPVAQQTAATADDKKAERPEVPLVEVPPGPVPAALDAASLGKVKHSTAYLRVKLPNGSTAEGSGFFCAAPGIVMTNAHVLGMLKADSAPPSNVEVVAHSGERDEQKMTGTLLGVDRSNDLAVLRVPGEAGNLPPPLPVDTATNLYETQKVYVFGFPLGASLGKNITVSESSVSSLRRDDAGQLSQVQVNGGMHPGNSGGPVTDARGVVVGVSVAIIRGTQINFAIPGDLVRQVLFGRLDRPELGTAYQDEDQIRLPVHASCLDPLSRVREVKFDVWTGAPGETRPASAQEPAAAAGDGPHSTVTAVLRNGAYNVDVPLPATAAGQVCWLRPVLVKAGGATEWEKAVSIPLDGRVILRRRPVALQFKPPSAAVERTLRINSTTTLTIYQSKEVASLSAKLEGDALESLRPDPRGVGTAIRLTLGPCNFLTEAPGKKVAPPRQAATLLSQFSPTFMVDPANACKERGKRNFNVVAPTLRDTVEKMYETVCNTYESTTMPLPNRTVRPLDSWQTRMPMFVLTRGKRQVQDIFLTCTYEGVRSVAGHDEAHLALSGVVKGRGPTASRPMGKAHGHAQFDVEKGFLSLVQLTVSSEAEIEEAGVRVLINDESTIRRSEGNLLGIPAATRNQPSPGGR